MNPRGPGPPNPSYSLQVTSSPGPAATNPTEDTDPTGPDRRAAPPTHPHLVSFVSGHGVKTAVVSAHLPARQHRLFLPLHLLVLGGLTSHSAPRTYARRHHSPSRSRGEGFVLQNFLYVSPPTPRRAKKRTADGTRTPASARCCRYGQPEPRKPAAALTVTGAHAPARVGQDRTGHSLVVPLPSPRSPLPHSATLISAAEVRRCSSPRPDGRDGGSGGAVRRRRGGHVVAVPVRAPGRRPVRRRGCRRLPVAPPAARRPPPPRGQSTGARRPAPPRPG